MRSLLTGSPLLGMTILLSGLQQGTPVPTPTIQAQPTLQARPEVLNLQALAEQGKALLEQAQQGSGSVGITLAHYPGHYTMLTARTKSGGAELHKHYADFLFVIAGQGTEMTGGTIVDPKELPNGELRGTRLEGAARHTLHTGDFIHIPAGTPHQAIEDPGQSITVFVIKVQEPEAQP